MTNEREVVEHAAKACGIYGRYVNAKLGIAYEKGDAGNYRKAYWNPLTNSADTAEMCAKLNIDSYWWKDFISCAIGGEVCKAKFEDHSNSRLKAWMYAATMVAAKI